LSEADQKLNKISPIRFLQVFTDQISFLSTTKHQCTKRWTTATGIPQHLLKDFICLQR